MKVLVAIADFGFSPTLPVVRQCFAKDGFTTVVFSTEEGENIYPASIGEDLPFMHRQFFVQEQGNYDFFIFTENDIYFSDETLQNFFANYDCFGHHFPLGLLRFEFQQLIDFGAVTDRPKITSRDDISFIPANVHQACYILTQRQLKECIDSGNYLIGAEARGGYGKLETGASNVYFECGLQKLYPTKNLQFLAIDHLRPRWADKQPKYLLEDLYRDVDNIKIYDFYR